MVVTATLLQAADKTLTVAEAGTALTTYQVVAKALLDNDSPGMSSTLYDWCHALLICHLLHSSNPEVGLKGHTSGDYSEQREPGVTTWLIQYQQIISTFRRTAVSSSSSTLEKALRADSVMGDFKLDQGDLPEFYTGVD